METPLTPISEDEALLLHFIDYALKVLKRRDCYEKETFMTPFHADYSERSFGEDERGGSE